MDMVFVIEAMAVLLSKAVASVMVGGKWAAIVDVVGWVESMSMLASSGFVIDTGVQR